MSPLCVATPITPDWYPIRVTLGGNLPPPGGGSRPGCGRDPPPGWVGPAPGARVCHALRKIPVFYVNPDLRKPTLTKETPK